MFGIDLSQIEECLNNLYTGYWTCIWGSSYQGLYIKNIEIIDNLKNCKNLEKLTINISPDYSNNIDLTGLINLKECYLSSNGKYILSSNVEKVSTWSLKYAPDLTYDINLKYYEDNHSNFSNDEWQKLLETIKNCTQLESLCFNSCYNLDAVDLPETLTSLKELKITSLTNTNAINTNTVKKMSGIENLVNLENITVNLPYLNYIDNFSSLVNVKTLNLSNCQISSLKALENLKSLTTLYLENNCIYDTSSYDDNGNIITYNNLEILANLNRTGCLKSVFLEGNNGIIDWSPISDLKWNEYSGW